jgi:hypothetical protein
MITNTIKTVWRFPTTMPKENVESDPKAWPFVPGPSPEEERIALLNKAVLQKVGIVHIFDTGYAKGGLTIAYRKSTPHRAGSMVDIAVATCSKYDVFSKKIGTQRALEMFFAGKTIQLPLLQTFAKDDLSYAIKRSFTKFYDYI